MNDLNDIEAKLTELESRVADIKDLKQKYEEDKRRWDEEREQMQKRAGATQKLKEALAEFMELDSISAPALARSTKETLNLKHKELAVNLTHEEKVLNMTTDTVNGKVLFCALTELPKNGFCEAELSENLKEHGWNVGHTTLAPQLGGLVRDGYLVKLEGSRPSKYRLPGKLKINMLKT